MQNDKAVTSKMTGEVPKFLEWTKFQFILVTLLQRFHNIFRGGIKRCHNVIKHCGNVKNVVTTLLFCKKKNVVTTLPNVAY